MNSPQATNASVTIILQRLLVYKQPPPINVGSIGQAKREDNRKTGEEANETKHRALDASCIAFFQLWILLACFFATHPSPPPVNPSCQSWAWHQLWEPQQREQSLPSRARAGQRWKVPPGKPFLTLPKLLYPLWLCIASRSKQLLIKLLPCAPKL